MGNYMSSPAFLVVPLKRSIAMASAFALCATFLFIPHGFARGDETGRSMQESPPAHRINVALLIGPGKSPDLTTDTSQWIEEARTHIQDKEFDDALEAANKLIREEPGNPNGYNLQGGAYFGKKDYASARKSFERALELRPDNSVVLANLAQVDLRQNNVASARKKYQAILGKDPKSVVAMVGMAHVEAKSRKEKEGLAWLEKAKSANPQALAPRVLLGDYYLRSRSFSKAVSELTEAEQHFPDNPQVLNLLGQAQAESGQTLAAVSTYRKLVSVAPNSPVAHYRLASVMSKSGDVAAATESLKKALQLQPDFAEPYYELAELDVRAKRYDEAVKRARELQRITPSSPAGFLLEGDVFAGQQRYTDAIAAYEKAWRLEQTGPTVLKLHAAYRKAGNAKEADSKIQAWLKNHPEDMRVLLYRAGENLKEERNQVAIEQYEAILKLRPDNVLALNNLAQLYHRQKDPRALVTAERAHKLAPNTAWVSDTLGWILVEQGKTKRGLELLRRAAADGPQVPEIRYHLAVALAKSGEKAKARKELEGLLAGSRIFPEREAAEQLLKQL